MSDCKVLIAGAGPTGLVLALWLTKQGVPVRIVDLAAEAGTTSRALAVHARTLELYRQLDLTDAVVARGHRTAAARLWVGGEQKASVSFEHVGEVIRQTLLVAGHTGRASASTCALNFSGSALGVSTSTGTPSK